MVARIPVPRAALPPVLVFAAGAALQLVYVRTGLGDAVAVTSVALLVLAVPVVFGVLLGARVPGNPVGPALAWVGAAPCATFAVEDWGASPWPGSGVVGVLSPGVWVWNLAGFVALCLVFPNGLLPGWRRVAGLAGVAGLVVNATGAVAAGTTSVPVLAAAVPVGFGSCLAALGAAVVSLVVRYRRGDEVTRWQLRWLVLGAGTVPVLLAAGWVAQSFGASPALAYTGFLLAMLLAVPAAVLVAVLAHDLFDVDRLLGQSLSWLVTTVLSAAIFAGAVALAGVLGADSRLGVTGAAFVTALALQPLHRRLAESIGRIVDRDRYVLTARLRAFVGEVRDGTTSPDRTEDVLRGVLGDPGLRLLLRRPGEGQAYVDIAGSPADPPEEHTIPLRSGGADVGLLALGTASARRLRRAREAAVEARLPIEVVRLQLHLADALREVSASRQRLLTATAQERRKLERDLHDGAQQRIVAVGMRLRSLQRTVGPEAVRELDTAVESLEATIAELRRLAQGVRPSLLDDGLPVALQALVGDSPIPVELAVDDVRVSDPVATSVYYLVAEAYANALKHAGAGRILIAVTSAGEILRVEVSDDGVGGAGTELPSVRDRIAAVGGSLAVHSPPGGGTTVTVEIAHACAGR
ncbi:histidine kinase [Cryptosporangium sp. NPDC051539]|uniref:histidine kinase n=1 Tax=Cryptosporangium sp. NPDC051539 TaxID=3363962 RepID=UPI00379BD86A